PPPPPPPPAPQPTRGTAKARDAAPPAPIAEAAPLAVAIPIAVPSFAPAPVPAAGVAQSSGAAAAGTGTGAGGSGTGTGGGGTGDGGGSPPSPRAAIDPQVIRGGFNQSDYPKELRAQGPKGTTWAEVIVGTNGRVTSCRISRPSGIPQFDTKTCQILFQRFRYRPARDAAGRPVAAPDSFSVDWDYVDLTEE
ncbi:MAG: TonB family protein, partial [Novosphingobium sp.]